MPVMMLNILYSYTSNFRKLKKKIFKDINKYHASYLIEKLLKKPSLAWKKIKINNKEIIN